ncbi:hypothetical protein Enr13x_24390 [Stieleria neptunia]|uniref:Uncharacterized protein n=1 Tax=Stieleria neptunia TaxID=2527979 RepID=A0A518HP35_9BACT|nr:hypothetical protein Enr13x_24390 [Stieleria neptunia]
MGAAERRGDRKMGDKKIICLKAGGILRAHGGEDEIEGLKYRSPSIVRGRMLVT